MTLGIDDRRTDDPIEHFRVPEDELGVERYVGSSGISDLPLRPFIEGLVPREDLVQWPCE